MSMWRDQGPNKKDGVPVTPEVAAADGRLFTAEASPAPPVPAATPSVVPAAAPTQRHSEAKESLIAADISIEGKIEGAGHVRLAGRFKGDVNVKGDLTIERGAKLNGGVRANKVIIAGELEGNIESAAQVELQTSGV
ncbi:polymer-forming cytoskeletal protein, partial [Xanthomonas citri pv. citri]